MDLITHNSKPSSVLGKLFLTLIPIENKSKTVRMSNELSGVLSAVLNV
jgi:hypothetical protein